MIIAEIGRYSLTKYSNRNGDKTSVKESDHKTLILKLNYKWKSSLQSENERIEVFNYKNAKHFEKFIQLTYDNKELREYFDVARDN